MRTINSRESTRFRLEGTPRTGWLPCLQGTAPINVLHFAVVYPMLSIHRDMTFIPRLRAGIDAAPSLGHLVLRYCHLLMVTIIKPALPLPCSWLRWTRNMQADARIDPESLERDNDRDIDSLADKTSFLRKVWVAHEQKSLMC